MIVTVGRDTAHLDAGFEFTQFSRQRLWENEPTTTTTTTTTTTAAESTPTTTTAVATP